MDQNICRLHIAVAYCAVLDMKLLIYEHHRGFIAEYNAFGMRLTGETNGPFRPTARRLCLDSRPYIRTPVVPRSISAAG